MGPDLSSARSIHAMANPPRVRQHIDSLHARLPFLSALVTRTRHSLRSSTNSRLYKALLSTLVLGFVLCSLPYIAAYALFYVARCGPLKELRDTAWHLCKEDVQLARSLINIHAIQQKKQALKSTIETNAPSSVSTFLNGTDSPFFSVLRHFLEIPLFTMAAALVLLNISLPHSIDQHKRKHEEPNVFIDTELEAKRLCKVPESTKEGDVEPVDSNDNKNNINDTEDTNNIHNHVNGKHKSINGNCNTNGNVKQLNGGPHSTVRSKSRSQTSSPERSLSPNRKKSQQPLNKDEKEKVSQSSITNNDKTNHAHQDSEHEITYMHPPHTLIIHSAPKNSKDDGSLFDTDAANQSHESTSTDHHSTNVHKDQNNLTSGITTSTTATVTKPRSRSSKKKHEKVSEVES